METGVKAFFYDYKYYLLPEICESAEEVKKLKCAEVKRLKEENCMAPDFVYESIETELLIIEEPDCVFPVTVSLYSREEYDALLLKQVKGRCPGCARYSDDGTDEMNGHYREMSLSGVCYSREDESPDSLFSFGRAAIWFWERVAASADELAALADAGDQKGVNALVNGILTNFFLPLEFFAGVEDGRYCLCMSSGNYPQHSLRVILKALSETAAREDSAMNEAGWRVYPYFPKDVYVPALRPDYFKRPPRLFCSDGEEGGTEIAVYEKGAEEWSERKLAGRKAAVYKYLCRYIGENVLLASCEFIAFVGTPPKGKREVTVEELSEILEQEAKERFDDKVVFPPPIFLETSGMVENALPYKAEIRTWMTVCPELSPELSDEVLPDYALFEAVGIIYAYIYLPGGFMDGVDAWRHEVWAKYFSCADAAPLILPENREVFALEVGATFAPDGICCDYMVFDEREFFRVLARLAPVLEGLNAKIVTVKRDGVIVYDPGYVIRPEDSELYS